MSADENKAVVLRFYAALDSQMMDDAMALLAPTCVAHLPGAPWPQDPAGFRGFGVQFYTAFPDGHHTFDEVIAEGDKVVTRGTFSGTHRGELQGMPPTGRHVSLSVIHIDHLALGKIVEHWGQADMMGFMQQLGQAPHLSTLRRGEAQDALRFRAASGEQHRRFRSTEESTEVYPMSAEENKALVRRFVQEVIGNGNLAVADELIAPAYVYHGPGIKPQPR